MPAYKALQRIVLPGGIVEPEARFESDLVPGSAWLPLDDAAKAAVLARDEAEAAEAVVDKGGEDVVALQTELAAAEAALAEANARINELQAGVESLTKAETVVAPVDQAKRDSDIESSLDLLNEHDFVKTGARAGRPKCSAVENIVGYPVFPAELDAAWDKRPVTE